jgi:hypothetical protein
LAKINDAFAADLKKFDTGQSSYIDLQKSKVTALKALQANSQATKLEALQALKATQ